MMKKLSCGQAFLVAPFAGAWIEIFFIQALANDESVAPFAGAWIEIEILIFSIFILFSSLPSRERGLKYIQVHALNRSILSLPSRERGLKFLVSQIE